MLPPSDSPPSAQQQNRLSKRAAGVVGVAVACSRVLGLVREMVIAALFNSFATDVFYQAFRVPNLLRDLFAEGALSTAFITTFSKKIATEGDDSAWRLANKMATLTTIFMSLVTLLGVLFSPQLVGLIAGGYPLAKQVQIIQLTQIMFPFILLVSLAALAMGMLNAKNVFGMPAMASSFFNLGSIIAGTGLGWWMDPTFGSRALIGLSIGTLIGGLLQLVVQFPALWRVGFRFRLDFLWRDDGVRQILLLMGPAVIAASAVQVNVLVNARFASFILGDGPASWLTWAFRLMQLPLGIFGVAVATVTLPVVSRYAAVRDLPGVRSTLSHGLRLVFLLTTPCAVGFYFFAEPIISLIYQHGGFTFLSAYQTAAALKFYALGLVAYAGIKVIAPAFYAINKRNLPMLVSFFSIATNYALNQFFTFHLGWRHCGLAFSTSLVAIINFAILYWMMTRHIHGLETKTLLKNVGKFALASAPLALVCLVSQHWYFAQLDTMAFLPKLTGVILTIGIGAAVFVTTVMALRVEEVEDVVQMVKRKLKRRGVAGK